MGLRKLRAGVSTDQQSNVILFSGYYNENKNKEDVLIIVVFNF
jgi:hypothetical protein